MKAYSKDLRIRVVRAYENQEGSIRKLARIFQTSKEFVQNMLNLYRRTGDVTHKPHGGGAKLKITDEVLKNLQTLLEKNPDATEQELSELLQKEHGIQLSRATVGRGIRKINWTRKKKRFMIPNETQMKSKKSERNIKRR